MGLDKIGENRREREDIWKQLFIREQEKGAI